MAPQKKKTASGGRPDYKGVVFFFGPFFLSQGEGGLTGRFTEGDHGAGTVVEVAELVAGDVVGVGGEVELVVEPGSVGRRVEFADQRPERLEADVARVVVAGLSPEAVDVGSVVELVWHWEHSLFC